MAGFLPDGFLPDGHIPTGHLPELDEAAERIEIDIDGYYIPVKDPDGSLLLTFDFTAELDTGVTLASVLCTVPTGITKSNEATHTVDGTFDVDIDGGLHAGLYILSLVGTLSNGQTVSRDWPIRLFNS